MAVPRPVLALTALAALLRVPLLGAQSLWLDETLTGRLARGSLSELLRRLGSEEANPPLYYLAMWAWTRVAGLSEWALRLPSALCGVAAVAVAYAIGETLGSRRIGYVLAALVAVDPLLVYYSGEARGYSAVALLVALSFLFFARAMARRPGRSLAWWALCSALAIGVHWFAGLVVALEALALLWTRRRAALPAVAAVAVVGAALTPLLLEQRSSGVAENVTAGVGLAERAKGVPTSWLVGERGAAVSNLEWLLAALMVAALALLAFRVSAQERRAAALAALVGGGGLAALMAAALAGSDYVNNRNTVPFLVALLAVPAVALGAGRAGLVIAGLLCAGMLLAIVTAALDPEHERHDWRTTAKALGAAPAGGRVLVVAPGYNDVPLRWYRPEVAPLPAAGVRASELDVVLTDPLRQPLPDGALAATPAPGFTPAGTQRIQRMLIARYRSPRPRPVRPADVNAWARAHLDAARGAGGATALG